MEEIQDNKNEIKQVNVELIYYLNDDKEKKGNLKFTYDKEIEVIFYKDITKSFYSFLKENQQNILVNSDGQYFDVKENNIIYESIRYFVEDGWIILKENEVIFIDDDLTINNLKIMIYCDIICSKEMNIKKKYDNIDEEISYIYKLINKEKNNNELKIDAPLNLIVLTSNPLMHGEKELRTMNDFNIITSKIYKSFEEEDYLKYTKFWPLTLNTLKDVISNKQKRPVILHLICKSTYIIPDQGQEKEKKPSENSEDYTNLIFEDDNNYYNLKFIDKEKLENEIFNYNLNPELKENVNKIILIISTPLSHDVYNIFKNFGFKNIIIQHTTLADVNFIADFNYTFYKDIITHLPQPINNIYEDALKCEIDGVNPPTFCCCFHKHKTTCDFFKNLKNELYNSKKDEKLEDFKLLVPHFNHLFPDCYSNATPCQDKIDELKYQPECSGIKFLENSFCFHISSCLKNFRFLPEIKAKDKIIIKIFTFANLCCCKEEPQIHNINSTFITDFSAENNNNEIRFRNAEIMRENGQYTPNYDKMISFIGNNEVIYEVLKFFSSNNKQLNIYGDNLENLKKFGDVLIEYYLERYYFFESKTSSLNITRIKSAQLNLNEDNSNDNISDIELHQIKSAPLLGKINKIDFIQVKLNNANIIDSLKEEVYINNNMIYFIYVYDSNLKDKITISNKIVWFSEKEDLTIKNRIKFNKEPILKEKKEYLYIQEANPNEYIKFQNKRDVRNWWRRKNK